MTIDEAIKFANCLKNNYTIDFNDMPDFCDMVIKALEQQSSELLILKANLLLRQDALKEWEENIKKGKKEGLIILPSYFEPILVPNDIEIKIEQQQKTGHWTHDGSNWTNRWICSECGYKLCYEQSRFCPECGARMEVKE